MRHTRHFKQTMPLWQMSSFGGGRHVAEICVPAFQARCALAFIRAGLTDSVCVGIIVSGAKQVDDVTLQIVFFKHGGHHGLLHVSRQSGGETIVPCSCSGATSANISKATVRLRSPVVEVQISRWIGDDVTDMDMGSDDLLRGMTYHRIALHELASSRVARQHNIF